MGSWFSSGNSDQEKKGNIPQNNGPQSNGPQSNTRQNIRPQSNNSKKIESDIFYKIQNIYVQRHAVSCANTIEKVFEKGQKEKTKYAPNSGISYVGVQQCLQVSDYFSKNPINTGGNGGNGGNGKKPLLIFCCSELIRTHQTLFLSWIRYLKDYQDRQGKIIVIPWLNEVSATKVGSMIINKDNYPASFIKTKQDWENFIATLIVNIENIQKDTCNPDCKLVDDINLINDNLNWESLFYLSPIIYKTDVPNRLSNSGKKITIRRKGVLKKMGDLDQFIGLFGKMLNKYISDQGIDMEKYNGIELVIVAHHNSAEKFMEFILPNTHDIFKKQQLVNCEVVRLPGECMHNFVKKERPNNNLQMERIFPMQFNTELSISIAGKKVYPMFILYISELDIFLSVNNIVKTCLKVEGMNKCVKIKKPLEIFLKIPLIDYRFQLINIKNYIEIIIKNYEGKNGPTFYDYSKMLEIIKQKIIDLNIYLSRRQTINKKFQPGEKQRSSIQNYIVNQMNNQLLPKGIPAQKEMENFIQRKKKLTITDLYYKLNKYLFDMCGLDPEVVKLIAVF